MHMKSFSTLLWSGLLPALEVLDKEVTAYIEAKGAVVEKWEDVSHTGEEAQRGGDDAGPRLVRTVLFSKG